MSTEKGPVGSFLSTAWLVLLACVLLWTAVWVLQQIWAWLLLIVLVVLTIWLTIRIVRWRRDRWLG